MSFSSDSIEYQLLWRINQRCNLQCDYCFRQGVDECHDRENPDCLEIDPDKAVAALDATGQRWRIHLTGGEPFLHPKIIPLAEALTRSRHRLSINTNLVPPAAVEFAERVHPARIHSINASYHLDELESRKLKSRWIDTFLKIQHKGFPIRLMYLTHPAWLDRTNAEIEALKRHGIGEIYFKIFRGPYAERFYPIHFSDQQRLQIAGFGLTPHEQAILDTQDSFLGKPCRAGHSAFDLDLRGHLTRCSTLRESRGDLYERQFTPDLQPQLCTAETCLCPYQGLHFSLSTSTPGPGSEKVGLRMADRLKRWLRSSA